MKPYLAILALPFLLAGVGCKSKSEEAVERVKARQSPGFVRIINLGATEVRAFDGNRGIGTAKSGAYSKATTIGVGKRTVRVTGGKDPAATVQLSVATKEVYTIIAWPDGTISSLAEGMPRMPVEMTNGFVAFADHSGSKTTGTATIVGPGGKKIEVNAGKPLMLMPGTYKSADGKTEIKVESQYSYALLFFEHGGKVIPVFAINSDDVKAAVAGSA